METNPIEPLASTNQEDTSMSGTTTLVTPPSLPPRSRDETTGADVNTVVLLPRERGRDLYVWAAIALFIFGAPYACWRLSTPLAWAAVALGMVVVSMAAGYRTNGYCFGLFVTERNTVSLSRFQLAVWTFVVLSAFLTIAMKRLFAGSLSVPDPLAINLPWQLWALMGISTTSLVGSPLLSVDKSLKTPGAGVISRAQARTDADEETKVSDGTLYRRPWDKMAELSDMFRGDEVGNFYIIDVAKLQMFYFTLVCVLAYAVVLGQWLVEKQPADLSSFPALSDGLIALIGISHAGYLGSKKLDHSGADNPSSH
jgi:hypothetical protein